MARRPFTDPQTDAKPKRRWLRIVAIASVAYALVIGAIYAAIVIAFPPERLAALLANEVKAAK